MTREPFIEGTLSTEVVADKLCPGDWRVETIDSKTGDCFVTVFSGPNAEHRAVGYFDYMASPEGIRDRQHLAKIDELERQLLAAQQAIESLREERGKP